jgi:glycosyltransferase involved in cell wall biosynthesis
MTSKPTVSVVLPVLDEERHLAAVLGSIGDQTYPAIVEVLVVDGGSKDRTREVAAAWPSVTVLDNPRRIQAAALNVGLRAATGDVVVRVDGHCQLEPMYVERCVDALETTGAAMAGGAMTPVAHGWFERGVAAAMASRLGAGPARFHVGGAPGWTDTVYLGAYRRALALDVGGYAEDVGVNEDAELAHRMAQRGGVWFDPAIRSTYTPRDSIGAVARQFYRYGLSRAATVRRHPGSLAARQLAAPGLVLGLLTPWRRWVALGYGAVVVGRGAVEARHDAPAAAALVATMPAMHLAWGAGFLLGLAGQPPPRPVDAPTGPHPA